MQVYATGDYYSLYLEYSVIFCLSYCLFESVMTFYVIQKSYQEKVDIVTIPLES